MVMMIKNNRAKILWLIVGGLFLWAFASIAIVRGETVNSLWLVAAAICLYAIAYRFYSAWIIAKVLTVDETRATPAERLNDGHNFMPTNRWIVFGHHFAAIAGPGPLIGPTLAAQFGYLPGTLWILVGSVLGGCVQDMTTLFFSVRRNGRSLGQMARDEIGVMGGVAALIGTFVIMIILIAVLGLVVVNALKHSPWGTATVAATLPIAIFIGIYMRYLRVGRVLEASILGVALLIMAVFAGGWLEHQPTLSALFDHEAITIAWAIIIYGFAAATLPVWLILAPRDYLSTFMKLGTVLLLALSIFILHPVIKMPAMTQFMDGSGPIFGGKVFPFVFITIACGAISGFHALVSSGTTPKLISNERDIPMIGYGGMLLESFVAIMAMIAATILDPGIYFAVNSPVGAVGKEAIDAVTKISSWGFPVTVESMQQLANEMGEQSLFARTGGAPSLAIGMASILGNVFGRSVLAVWYHFAIMFEAIFILTTLDAGTRVGRFMLQDILGNIWPKMADSSWIPSVLLTSFLVVTGWGYFLYIGVIDPNGGVNILWPLFGIANQMLATIALCVATTILIKSGKIKQIGITALPLIWLMGVTTTAAFEKLTSDDPRVGFFAGAKDMANKLAQGLLPADKMAVAPQLIFNQKLDAWILVFLVLLVWILFIDMVWVLTRYLRQRPVPPLSEAPFERSALID
jgi:carbon starvation protein